MFQSSFTPVKDEQVVIRREERLLTIRKRYKWLLIQSKKEVTSNYIFCKWLHTVKKMLQVVTHR